MIDETFLPPVPQVGTEDLTQQELELIRGWREVYEETHPRPKEPVIPSFSQAMGLEAITAYTSAWGGVMLSALRTGSIFLITEELLLKAFGVTDPFTTGFLKWAVCGLSVVTFETYLLSTGMGRGRQSGEIKTNIWGVGVAFAVSSVAGLASSMPLANVAPDSAFSSFLGWVLAFLTGIGATFMAFLGSENIGILRNKYGVMVEGILQRYQVELAEWNATLQADFRRSGRQVLGGRTWKESTKVEGKRSPSTPRVEGELSTRKLIEEFLARESISIAQVGDGKEFLISPMQLSQEIGKSDGSVRTALSRIRADLRVPQPAD